MSRIMVLDFNHRLFDGGAIWIAMIGEVHAKKNKCRTQVGQQCHVLVKKQC